MSDVKAIETSYKGYRFRSRLEARWAVFFDTMNIEWVYEPEGFDLPCGKYLPDFWLPQVSMYAEVKAGIFSAEEFTRCVQLFDATKQEVLLLSGAPDFRFYPAIIHLEFEHGGWDALLRQYDLMEGHQYWTYEHRFYGGDIDYIVGDGCDPETPSFGKPPTIALIPLEGSVDDRGIYAARSARFEHGESGRSKPRRYRDASYEERLNWGRG